MYLHSINIKNFRRIQELNVEFNDGLNVIIGENNSGKTTVIDALRICLGWGSPKRELFVMKSDYYIDTKNHGGDIKPIEFKLTFYPHTDKETGILREP